MRKQAAKPAPATKPTCRGADARFTDFATLPGYDELRLQRSIGDKFGLENPYFRMHDGARRRARRRSTARNCSTSPATTISASTGIPRSSPPPRRAIDRYGISCSASRMWRASARCTAIWSARWPSITAAKRLLVFVSGYATNVGVIGQLVGPKDLIVSDAVVHNSAVMGSVLSGASRRSFTHNDLDNLEEILAADRAASSSAC